LDRCLRRPDQAGQRLPQEDSLCTRGHIMKSTGSRTTYWGKPWSSQACCCDARYPADCRRFRLPVEDWLPVSQGDGKENVPVSFDE
jgi:hypothetical protein